MQGRRSVRTRGGAMGLLCSVLREAALLHPTAWWLPGFEPATLQSGLCLLILGSVGKCTPLLTSENFTSGKKCSLSKGPEFVGTQTIFWPLTPPPPPAPYSINQPLGKHLHPITQWLLGFEPVIFQPCTLHTATDTTPSQKLVCLDARGGGMSTHHLDGLTVCPPPPRLRSRPLSGRPRLPSVVDPVTQATADRA